jgi:glycine/D-amino acid oxidase-like deaminating enzyme
MDRAVDVVICGAGIAGVSAAYHLSVKHGIQDILLVDERPPLSLTSDKSTECYRNWWVGPDNAMVALMNHSIDLMERLAEQSGNVFHLNRRGYLYVTGDEAKIPQILETAQIPPGFGAGELRVYRGTANDPHYSASPLEGYHGVPDGADLFLDAATLHKHFPYLSEKAVAGLHARRAGWFSAQQLGAYLLSEARRRGVRLQEGRVTGFYADHGKVSSVSLADGNRLKTGCFVDAAGPFLPKVAKMLGVELPVFSELHLKVAMPDPLEAVPRSAPLLIWNDAQRLPWSEEESQVLLEDQADAWLLNEMPAGVHTRPEGGAESNIILILWEYHSQRVEPVFPVPVDSRYPEIALRGMAAMLPGFQAYFERPPRPYLDGGYYTKTPENRPLIGALPVDGAYVIGALSGYGLMSSCAAGELLAAHVTGSELPAYAPAFSLERYADPAYQRLLQSWGDTGQL